jgi:predicted outer membrane repeat protein
VVLREPRVNAKHGYWRINLRFLGNQSSGAGGALLLDAASPEISDCVFSGNTSGASGGAVRAVNASAPFFSNSEFKSNVASGDGGAVSHDTSPAEYQTCRFSANESAQSGGAVANASSASQFTNSELSGNRASGAGGAVFNEVGSAAVLTNCTVQGNRATLGGGGIANDASNPVLTNLLVWQNEAMGVTTGSAASIDNQNGSTPIYAHTLAENMDLTASGTGNLDGTDAASDPGFLDPTAPSSAPFSDGDLGLRAFSPAIDAGDNAAISLMYDLAGKPRKINGDRSGAITVDLGAYELAAIIFVDSSILGLGGANNGSSWVNAFVDLQDALASASSGTELWIADGIYSPDLGAEKVYRDRDETFTLKNGVSLYGGFAGHETGLKERDPAVNESILSGDLFRNDAASGFTDNSYHVVTATAIEAGVTLDGTRMALT